MKYGRLDPAEISIAGPATVAAVIATCTGSY